MHVPQTGILKSSHGTINLGDHRSKDVEHNYDTTGARRCVRSYWSCRIDRLENASGRSNSGIESIKHCNNPRTNRTDGTAYKESILVTTRACRSYNVLLQNLPHHQPSVRSGRLVLYAVPSLAKSSSGAREEMFVTQSAAVDGTSGDGQSNVLTVVGGFIASRGNVRVLPHVEHIKCIKWEALARASNIAPDAVLLSLCLEQRKKKA